MILLLLGPIINAQEPRERPLIPPGSAVYVAHNKGFEIFIEAALKEKAAQLRIVSHENLADFIFHTTLVRTRMYSGATSYYVTSASCKLESKGGEVVWAYSVSKGILSSGRQSVAEACAKHLKSVLTESKH